MPRPPSKPAALDHDRRLVRLASRSWILAGVSGMTFCVAVAFSSVFRHVPPPLAATLTIACGWLMLLLMSPWRIMRRLAADQRLLMHQVNTRLDMIADGNRAIPLKDLIIEQDDELGRLSRKVHDLAAAAYSNRQHVRMLQKRMGDDVARETRTATLHLERQAATDPLTGLGNRRALDRRIGELLDECADTGCLVTLVAIDVNLFKSVNDALGHETGDKCLVFLADLLKSNLRRDDLPVRLGGDEFIVLMPDQSLEIGRAVAVRLCKLFEQMPWPHPQQPRPTLSFGVASQAIGDRDEFAQLLREADAALYECKHSRASAAPRTHAQARRGAA